MSPPPGTPEPSTEVRRAWPLLGTIVEIRSYGLGPGPAGVAIQTAFGAVARVQAKMSPREPASDIARINRSRAGTTLRIDPWTWQVLAAAQSLAASTDGVFDVVAAGARRGTWRDLTVLAHRRVHVSRPLQIDLGGIAKGFAVDRAVDILRAAGASAGGVNAGGDLRVFGAPERVHVRHPANPALLVPLADLVDEAVATSANYFDAPGAGRLVHPHGKRLWLGRGSVSVRASSCLLADALCKVVAAIGPRRSAPLLNAVGATAFVLAHTGRVSVTASSEETARAA